MLNIITLIRIDFLNYSIIYEKFVAKIMHVTFYVVAVIR